MWKGDPFADVQSRNRYVGIKAYGRAKLLNVLFVLALARRVTVGDLSVNAVNPGMAWTPGLAALRPHAVPQWRLIWPVVRWFQRRASPSRAAAAPVWLATRPEAGESGRCYEGRAQKPLAAALLEVELQNRTWALGESLATKILAHQPPHGTRDQAIDREGRVLV